MDIQRVGIQGAFATEPGATGSAPANRSAIQSVDQLAQHHNARTHNNSCWIVRCFRRILDCIARIFRSLFGSTQPQETTRVPPSQPTQRAAPTPSQPANPPIPESLQQAQKELEEKIFVPENAVKKISELMPKIEEGNRKTGLEGSTLEIQHYNYKHSNNLVFTLILAAPNLVFKRSRSISHAKQETETEQHFANMIKAQEVCTKYQLNHLIIPHAKKFQVYDRTFIAQERFVPCPDELQEQNYKLSGLDEPVRELAIFIAHTGLNNVMWRKIPISDANIKKIVLINLEHMNGAAEGLYQLISCLFSEKQIDSVIDVIKQHSIVAEYTTPEKAKATRMKEIAEDQALFAWYQEKGLLDDPKKCIEPDLTTLGLNLEEQGTIKIKKTVTEGNITTTTKTETPIQLRTVAELVVAEINNKIQKATDWPGSYDGRVKAMRSVVVSTRIFDAYAELGVPADAPPPPHPLTKEQEMQKWHYRTLNALVQHRHIFKWEKTPTGYFFLIQG